MSLAWNRDSETLSGARMIDPLNEGRREEFIFSFAKIARNHSRICGGLLHQPIKLITFAFEFCPLRKHKLSFWWLWWARSLCHTSYLHGAMESDEATFTVHPNFYILAQSLLISDHVVVYLICSSFKYSALLLLLYMCNI